MYTKAVCMSAWLVLGAAIVSCSLLTRAVAAEGREFTAAYRVTTQGLDPNHPAGAHELYSRLKHAAEVVCTHGMRVDLKPVANEDACYQKALGDAIRSAKLPLLTQVYLETHTPREAAAHGIDLPVQLASK